MPFVSKTLIMLAQRFNTRNYKKLGRKFKNFKGIDAATTHPILLPARFTLQSWIDGYTDLQDMLNEEDLTPAQPYLNQGMPIDEIASDIAENHNMAQRSKNVIGEAVGALRICNVALLGEEYALTIVKAIELESLSQACQTDNRELIKNALVSISDINYQYNNGRTALWYAVWAHRQVAVEELLAAGADVNKQDKNGVSPLMEAVACEEGPSPAIVKKLVDAGANLSLKNYRGHTALELVKSLLPYRCREHIRKNREEVVQILKDALSAKSTP